MTWRDRFREDNELLVELIGGWRGKLYLLIVAATLAHQMGLRLPLCDGFAGCSMSFLKASVWSLVQAAQTKIKAGKIAIPVAHNAGAVNKLIK